MGDRCSRFLRHFCEHEWKVHPRTRHLGNFQCRFPVSENGRSLDPKMAESAWYMAQSVGSFLGVCPAPSTLLWPPSKITYPHCSAAIARLSLDRGLGDVASFGDDQSGSSDVVSDLQGSLASECPPPALFRWTPDATLWPECDQWIRMKCAPGSPCSTIGQHQQQQQQTSSNVTPIRQNTWSGSEAAQRSFAEAQNWCAGRGKCPRSRDGRWLPGPLFFPGCSAAIVQWCDEVGVLEECKNPPPPTVSSLVALVGIPARTKRFEAQKWAYLSGACPDPEHDFLWPWALDGAQPLGSPLENAVLVSSGLQSRHAVTRDTGPH